MATQNVTFDDVIQAVNVMGPLTEFVTYGGTAIAVVIAIAFAIRSVVIVVNWVQGAVYVAQLKADHDWDYEKKEPYGGW